MKQAREFGLPQSGIKMVALAAQTTDLHGMGLEVGQGTLMCLPFYWDLNEPDASLHSAGAAEDAARLSQRDARRSLFVSAPQSGRPPRRWAARKRRRRPARPRWT
jgi:hypothetical protein